MSVNPNASNNVSDHISIEGLAIAKFSRSIFKETHLSNESGPFCVPR